MEHKLLDRRHCHCYLLFLMVYFGVSNIKMEAASFKIDLFPKPSSNMYGKPGDIRSVLIDDKHRKITLASVNYILQLDMDSLKLINSVHIPTKKSAYESCIVSFEKNSCQNFFKVLLYDPDGRIFACGTNGGRPKCWRFENNTLELLPQFNITGVGRCPPDPKENVTSLFQGGYLFSATLLGSNKFTIYKAKVSKSAAAFKTHQSDLVFKEPRFVSSYYFGDGFVYFFFREVAVENSERKVIYSRVARVCQFDRGETLVSEDRFITFLKSQLVCVDTSGSIPTYFDELQSTFMLDVHTKSGSEKFVYGVFSTSSKMLGNSAVCRYKVKDIQKLFQDSKFSEKKNDGLWIAVNHPGKYPDAGRTKCTKDLDTQTMNYQSGVFSIEHPLLHSDVMPFDGHSIFLLPGVGVTSLVVKDVHFDEDKSDIGIHVLFAGTMDGIIYKVMINSTNDGSPYVIEKIRPFKEEQPITSLEISQDAVFAGSTLNSFARIPLDRCDQYVLCSDCVKSRDPFCFWSDGKCRYFKSATSNNKKGIQNVLSGNTSKCPPISSEIACTLQILEHYPGSKTVLECSPEGIPAPSVIAWTKGDFRMVIDGDRYETRNASGTKQQLVIRNYTLNDVGRYGCIVGRGKIRSSCSSVLSGSKPVINCSRYGQRCHCTVTGDPKPKIFKVVSRELIGVKGHTANVLRHGVSLFAVSAYGEAVFTCQIPTEKPTQPPNTTTATSRARTSSTTDTPATSAAPTTVTTATTATERTRPTAGPVKRQSCPECRCVSYLTPLIVVSVIVLIGFIVGIAMCFFARIKRYSTENSGDFVDEFDCTDGKKDIYIVKFRRRNSHKPSPKRNEAARNESRKALIRNSSNDSNQVYKPTVVDMNHKNDKNSSENHKNSGKTTL